MAIKWDLDGSLRVGIELTVSGTTITAKYYVGTNSGGYNWADNQTLNRTVNLTGSTNFYNDLTDPNEYMLVYTGTRTGNRGSTYTFGANITGAFNGDNPSVSDSIKVPALEPGKPGAPSFSSLTDTSFTVQFGAAASNGSSVDSYQVQIATDSNFNNLVYNESGSTRTRYPSGLDQRTTHYARARAHNGEGWGDWSSTGSTKTYGPPTVIRDFEVASIGGTSATLDWTGPSTWNGDNTGDYDIEYGLQSDLSDAVTVNVSGATTLDLDSLTPASAYYFRGKATNQYGDGDETAIISASTDAPPVYVKVSGEWKAVIGLYVKVSGTWKPVSRLWVKVNGSWK